MIWPALCPQWLLIGRVNILQTTLATTACTVSSNVSSSSAYSTMTPPVGLGEGWLEAGEWSRLDGLWVNIYNHFTITVTRTANSGPLCLLMFTNALYIRCRCWSMKPMHLPSGVQVHARVTAKVRWTLAKPENLIISDFATEDNGIFGERKVSGDYKTCMETCRYRPFRTCCVRRDTKMAMLEEKGVPQILASCLLHRKRHFEFLLSVRLPLYNHENLLNKSKNIFLACSFSVVL